MESLKQKGISIEFNTGIHRILGQGGQLSDIEYVDFSSMNRQTVSAQTLFLASGRFPELIFTRQPSDGDTDTETPPASPVAWMGIPAGKQPAFHDQTGLLAEGDPLTDISAAIRAIAYGRRGAASIHKVMYDIELTLPEHTLTPNSPIQTVDQLDDVKAIPRRIMPLSDQPAINDGKEIELGFSESMAKTEADRCLQCGVICYKKSATTILSHVVGESGEPSATSPKTAEDTPSIGFTETNRIL